MANQPRKIVISKEEAVFWLDGKGRWHNKFGPFQHKKIIDFFHSSIRKDKDGYFLTQTTDNIKEKVYFDCEDGAFFVFDVINQDVPILVLNTGKKTKLLPEKLWIKNDNLYMQDGQEQVKFTESSLLKLSDRIENDGRQYFIRIKNKTYAIRESRD